MIWDQEMVKNRVLMSYIPSFTERTHSGDCVPSENMTTKEMNARMLHSWLERIFDWFFLNHHNLFQQAKVSKLFFTHAYMDFVIYN